MHQSCQQSCPSPRTCAQNAPCSDAVRNPRGPQPPEGPPMHLRLHDQRRAAAQQVGHARLQVLPLQPGALLAVERRQLAARSAGCSPAAIGAPSPARARSWAAGPRRMRVSPVRREPCGPVAGDPGRCDGRHPGGRPSGRPGAHPSRRPRGDLPRQPGRLPSGRPGAHPPRRPRGHCRVSRGGCRRGSLVHIHRDGHGGHRRASRGHGRRGSRTHSHRDGHGGRAAAAGRSSISATTGVTVTAALGAPVEAVKCSSITAATGVIVVAAGRTSIATDGGRGHRDRGWAAVCSGVVPPVEPNAGLGRGRRERRFGRRCGWRADAGRLHHRHHRRGPDIQGDQ